MLNYIEFGERDTDRPSLLIAHGLYGSARNWGVICKRLSDSRHVMSVDMRNHGNSPWFETQSYLDMAADLAEVITAQEGPLDVCGHSMGGKAAMTLAITHPDLVRRLIVADIAPVTYSHTQAHQITAMRQVDLNTVTRRSDAEAQLADAGVERSLQSFFTQSLDVPNKRWRLNLDVLDAEMDEIIGFPALEGQFDGPTLFLSGGASDYVTAQQRPIIKAFFPMARFAKLPDAGHWLHAEKPREFEAAVRVFLGSGN